MSSIERHREEFDGLLCRLMSAAVDGRTREIVPLADKLRATFNIKPDGFVLIGDGWFRHSEIVGIRPGVTEGTVSVYVRGDVFGLEEKTTMEEARKAL